MQTSNTSPEAATKQKAAVRMEVPWLEEADPSVCWLPFSKAGVISIRSSSARMLGLSVDPGLSKGYEFIFEIPLSTHGEPREVVANLELKGSKTGGSGAQQSQGRRLTSGSGSVALLRACGVDCKKRGRLQVRRGDHHVHILQAENVSSVNKGVIDLTTSERVKRPLQQASSSNQPAKVPRQTHAPAQQQQQAATGTTAGAMVGSVHCSVAERSEQVRHHIVIFADVYTCRCVMCMHT